MRLSRKTFVQSWPLNYELQHISNPSNQNEAEVQTTKKSMGLDNRYKNNFI
jgi:hypothetical protein